MKTEAAKDIARPPLACNPHAIDLAECPLYHDLCRLIRVAIRDSRETTAGYQFRLDTELLSLADAARWISLERLCCPFLSFELRVSGEGDPWLTLEGPSGSKEIIREEFL
jgi:hypothetical protein